MINRHQPVIPLFLLCFWLAASGCGSGEDEGGADPATNSGEPPTCETLASLVLQDPLRGGTFHCLWCSRQWKWRVAADSGRLFLLISLTCERLRGRARLELCDSEQSVVWQREIRQGDRETFCIRHEQLSGGVPSLRLHGTRGVPLMGNLIEEFQGSVYFKILNDRGEPAGIPVP